MKNDFRIVSYKILHGKFFFRCLKILTRTVELYMTILSFEKNYLINNVQIKLILLNLLYN